MNISLNTKDPHDVEVMKAITRACDNFALSQQETTEEQGIELESPGSVAQTLERLTGPAIRRARPTLNTTENNEDNTLIVTAQQAESLMGLNIKNIRKNASVMSDYRSFIRVHDSQKGMYIVGEKLKRALTPANLKALRQGYSLKVPIALSTGCINNALKKAYPENPPKFSPSRWRYSNNITIFSCKPENGKVLAYYLTLVEDLKENKPRFHMAIENHFLKRSF
tara:strand:- start:1442 stop:2113 length:672 start_codon:yes stop_codon:yes gene_type:complete